MTIFQRNPLFDVLGIRDDIFDDITRSYHEPHRYYHNIDHLENLINSIDQSHSVFKHDLKIISYFHDIIYDPRRTDNEYQSAQFFSSVCSNKNNEIWSIIYDAILLTNYKELNNQNTLFQLFKYHDFDFMTKMNSTSLLQNELKIMKEYQFMEYSCYVKNRIKFVRSVMELDNPSSFENILIYLQNYRPRIGVYAGSFNPFHIGHLKILEQAETMFDKVIILVARNQNKHDPIYCDVSSILPFHEVVSWDGLTTDYLKQIKQYADVSLVRGLRNGYDLQYEENLRAYMKNIMGPQDFNIVYFLSDSSTRHVSSSDLRSLEVFSLDEYEKYIPTKYDYARCWAPL